MRFVTLSGVPIEIAELRWPFHQSTSGSDWFVLHGRVDLLDKADSEKLHAEVAIALTQTMKDALGSLEPRGAENDAESGAESAAESMVVNAIRKTIDNGQLAFLKSGKLQPVHVTSRFYSFVRKKIEFPTQSEADVRELIKRRTFWLGVENAVEIAHPYDCQYVNFPREKMLDIAARLADEGLIAISGDAATPTEALRQQAPGIHQAMHKGVEAGRAATKISA
jgi:hypothetical protein